MNPDKIVMLPSQYQTISIIVPVYNVQDYVICCLESIAAQTYQGDMECILVNDCSTDQSSQLIEKFISSYQGRIEFKLLQHEHNQGLSASRNTGLKEARGELISFIDSDDWIEPNMYEELYKYLSNDPKALFVTSSIIADFPDKSESGYANTNMYEEGGVIEPYHFLEQVLATKTNNAAWNKLYRKEFFSIYFREGILCEDFMFFYDNCKVLIGKDYHFVTTPKAFYHYFIRSGSIMRPDSQSPQQWYIDLLVNMTIVLEDCRSTYPDLYDIQLKRFASVYGFYFYDIVNNKVLTTWRKETLNKLNKYVRVMDKHRFSLMTRLDMFVASYFPSGYCMTRNIVTFRKNIKLIVKR